MAQSPGTPIGDLGDGLRNVLNRVLSTRPQVGLALLFGSRARGSEHAGSDVDVAVLAPGEDLLALGSQLSQAVGTTVDLVSLEDPGFALLERGPQGPLVRSWCSGAQTNGFVLCELG